jgi:flagellar hook-associated protein 3 FlgL
MRVTSNLLVRDQLTALQSSAQAMVRAQAQVTTGKRMMAGSDDPVGSRDVMAADGRLRAITQYRRGLDTAKGRLALQDQVMTQVTSLLTRAQELTVAAATDTIDANSRATIQKEVEGMFNELVALANTSVEGEYLFGGHRVTERPFEVTGTGTTLTYTTTGAAGDRPIEVDAGRTIIPTDDGATLFLDTGVLDAVRDLAVELAGPASAGNTTLRAVGQTLTASFDAVQERVGALGARASTMDLVGANLDAFEGSLQAFRSQISEVDFEAAAVELISRQNAYQSALLASSKVLGLNLSDYLR